MGIRHLLRSVRAKSVAIVAYLQPLVDVLMTQHVVGTASISVDGDRAAATSYTTVTFVRPTANGGHEAVHRGLS